MYGAEAFPRMFDQSWFSMRITNTTGSVELVVVPNLSVVVVVVCVVVVGGAWVVVVEVVVVVVVGAWVVVVVLVVVEVVEVVVVVVVVGARVVVVVVGRVGVVEAVIVVVVGVMTVVVVTHPSPPFALQQEQQAVALCLHSDHARMNIWRASLRHERPERPGVQSPRADVRSACACVRQSSFCEAHDVLHSRQALSHVFLIRVRRGHELV